MRLFLSVFVVRATPVHPGRRQADQERAPTFFLSLSPDIPCALSLSLSTMVQENIWATLFVCSLSLSFNPSLLCLLIFVV